MKNATRKIRWSNLTAKSELGLKNNHGEKESEGIAQTGKPSSERHRVIRERRSKGRKDIHIAKGKNAT